MFDIEVFGILIVGIGLCYMGMHTLSSNFREIINIRFRSLIANRFRKSTFMGILGAIFSAVTGKTTSLSLMLSSLTSSKIIPMQKALSGIVWGIFGSCLMLYLSYAPIGYAFLFLVGGMGVLYTLHPSVKTKSMTEIAFGILILCFGFYTIEKGASSLEKIDWLKPFIGSSQNYAFYGFIAGALMTAIVRPLLIPLFFSIVMTQNSIFSLEFSAMFVFGCFAGNAWLKWMHSTEQKGPAQHLTLVESAIYLCSSLVFAILFYLETTFSIPLFLSLAKLSSSDASLQLSNMVIFNLFIVSSTASLFIGYLYKLICIIKPLKEKDDISRTKYISKGALQDPESAMDLIEIEQFRLFDILPQYMETFRSVENFSIQSSLERIHASYSNVHAEIQEFLTSFQSNHLLHKTFERFLSLLHRNNILTSIERNIYIFSTDISRLSHNQELKELNMKFIEALDTVLLMISDAVSSLDSTDISLLYSITESREDVMGKIRESYLSREHHLNVEERSKLLEIIVSFEKSIWLARQFCSLLGEGRKFRLDAPKHSDDSENLFVFNPQL